MEFTCTGLAQLSVPFETKRVVIRSSNKNSLLTLRRNIIPPEDPYRNDTLSFFRKAIKEERYTRVMP
jgi:hypothetical protein